MKSINSIIQTAFLSVLLFGCADFLQEDLQGTYSNSTFYQKAEHAELALTGIYNVTSFSNTNNNVWVFGDVASDDATKGGNPGDQNNIRFIEQFNYLPSNSYLENIWTHYYEGITRANYLLFYIPGIEMEEGPKKEIVAEATFLRAYFYFHLVNIFGEIPLKLNPPLNASEIHLEKSAIEKIYEQLNKDLLLATSDLPVQHTIGRATQGAAWGLLAKARLFQNDYDGAIDAIEAIEDLGVYELMPLYTSNFTLGNQNNKESLFEIQHISGASPKLGSALNQWFAHQSEGGYYFNMPVKDFIDEFENTSEDVVDPRLDYTVGREGQSWLNGEPFDPLWSPTGYVGKKHLQPLSEIPKGTKGDGNLNYVFMRYAEILLIKAEALNELNFPGQAIIPLNEVRKRARESYLYDENIEGHGTIPVNLLPEVIGIDQGQVRAAIRHERRVELGLEFHRFYDLMRYGKTVAEAALSETEFNYDLHRYFSIPLSERDINKAIE